MATFKDFRNSVKPNWCPGCGDFSVQAAIQRAAANVGLEPEQLAVVSGIGCSGRISGYINAYGLHGVHGRALPIAQGLKMANRELTVIASGGDGDGFAIGTSHTIHAMRRNIDMTYIVMDNQIYGLTKGQTSPVSELGFVTKSTPKGSIEAPLSPLEVAMAAGASFVAQTLSSDIKGMVDLIEKGLQHKGFSFINVFSPCVTFNKVNTYDWYKEHVKNLGEIEGYDPSNRVNAMRVLMENEGMVAGLIYQNNQKQPYETLVKGFREEGLAKQDLSFNSDRFADLVSEFM
ncbi:2-oxoacid:ferredoxin oxidoreductase subunit beta [Aneurinibacillus sp. Ricciae_BoGa-3]|uniref:2-oxoacid:ferredoxin oxidoreductase subunit beta n=1 Tax=Aneurinibacillus sp. Ricciae_BoGa-3 TaxID=3022697 RepID=UPI002341FBE3|nr:2-oxoacid:ferredoxin oxidoreductase subunit beta [Aneurinibacillus sp. Ricciae_BoGa-3]WCK56152.1 2-oxoacid:ferredoxin oxidoreductase subunit beta [Aneurinibacillus sp. Ricciae_BoGa-3]